MKVNCCSGCVSHLMNCHAAFCFSGATLEIASVAPPTGTEGFLKYGSGATLNANLQLALRFGRLATEPKRMANLPAQKSKLLVALLTTAVPSLKKPDHVLMTSMASLLSMFRRLFLTISPPLLAIAPSSTHGKLSTATAGRPVAALIFLAASRMPG